MGRRRTRAFGILFRNLLRRATVNELLITRATGQQLAGGRTGRFRTTRCGHGIADATEARGGVAAGSKRNGRAAGRAWHQFELVYGSEVPPNAPARGLKIDFEDQDEFDWLPCKEVYLGYSGCPCLLSSFAPSRL